VKATFYMPPNGRQEVREFTNVRAEDAEFFEKHGIKISMEPQGPNAIVYADTGKVTDGEPDELIEISGGRSCEDTLSALRKACEKRFAEEQGAAVPYDRYASDSVRPGIEKIREELRRNGIPEELIDGQAKLLWHDRQRAGLIGGAE